jgi:hypothetical protein
MRMSFGNIQRIGRRAIRIDKASTLVISEIAGMGRLRGFPLTLTASLFSID